MTDEDPAEIEREDALNAAAVDAAPVGDPVTATEGEHTPIPLRSDFPSTVNPSLVVYSGEMQLSTDSSNLVGVGQVELETQNGPTLKWRLEGESSGNFLSQNGRAELELFGYEGNPPKAEVIPLRFRPSEDSTRLSVDGITYREDTFEVVVAHDPSKPQDVEWVKFHLLNFRAFMGTPLSAGIDAHVHTWRGRVSFPFGPWIVTLDAVPNATEILEQAGAVKGFAVTHVGRLRRADGRKFPIGTKGKSGFTNAREALDALYWFLSFTNGSNSGILLPKGSRSYAPYVLWERWNGNITTRAATSFSRTWFCRHVDASRCFGAAEGFYERWKDPSSRAWLRRAIALYLASNQNAVGIELAFTISQNALELLSWTAMIEINNLMSEESFDKLPWADRLRTLLFWLQISTDIPPESEKLREAFKSWDAPKAITEMRNWLIHPTKRNRAKAESVGLDPVIEALYLSLWYIELAILRLVNYSGPYNRRLGNPTGRIFSIVPWQQQPST